MAERVVEREGVRLSVQQAGEGVPVVLLHGLTATHRHVVMGSKALERSGHRVISYDARGHGRSTPAPDRGAYGYEELGADLVAVLDALGIERAVLAGASMGAHTLLGLALRSPERAAGLVVITPGYDPAGNEDAERLARWDALADGFELGGVEGFLAAYGRPEVPEPWQGTVVKVIRQRLSEHEHPSAVADALRVVPRSRGSRWRRWSSQAAMKPTRATRRCWGRPMPPRFQVPGSSPRSRGSRRWPGRGAGCRR